MTDNIQTTLKKLKQPIPQNLISVKKIKNMNIQYVSWIDLAELLDQIVGLGCWSWEINQLTINSERLFLIGKLTLEIQNEIFSQSATGTEEMNCSSYGDPSSNAEAMAFRRAAAKFGLGRDLWRK